MNIFATIVLGIVYFISLFFAIFWLVIFLSEKKDFPKRRVTEYPMITIAVPAYNEQDSIAQTLDSIFGLDYPKEKMQIIVINDGSTDGTQKVVEQYIAGTTEWKKGACDICLLQQKNVGKGTALNNALQAARGEYFVCMDADSFVEKDALRKMLPYFSAPDIAAVIPMLKVKSPQNALQKLQWYEYTINMFYKELMGKLDCVHVIPGPFSMYNKKILKTVGGFDEHNMTEDLEIAFRLQSKDYRIIQLLNTQVETIAPNNMKELIQQRNRWFKGATLNAYHYKNMLFNRKYGDFGMMQVPSVLFSGVIAIILFISLIYYALKPYVLYFYNMSFVQFDFFTMLRDFTFNFKLLDLNFFTLFIGIIMLIVSLIILKRSVVAANEHFLKYGSVTLFIYLMLYFLLLGFIWLEVFAEIVVGKKQKW